MFAFLYTASSWKSRYHITDMQRLPDEYMEKLHETATVVEAVDRESLLLPSRTRTGRASEQAEKLQPFQIWKHWGKEVHCLREEMQWWRENRGSINSRSVRAS